MATLAQAEHFFQTYRGAHRLAPELVPRLTQVYSWFFEAGLSE
jgi:hypothetical protein